MKTEKKIFSKLIFSIAACALLLSFAATGMAADYHFQWENNPLNHLPYLSPDEKIAEFRIYWGLSKDNFTQYRVIPVGDPDNPPTSGSITIPDQAVDVYFVMTAVNNRGQESDPSNITGTHAPTVTGVAPAAGSKFGGLEISITGDNLFYGAAVSFGDVTVDPAVSPEKIKYESITLIKCILPQYPDLNAVFPVNVPVIVRKYAGSALWDRFDSFSYRNFGIYDVRVRDINSIYRDPVISDATLHLKVNDAEARFSVLGALNPQQAYTWKFYKNGGGVTTFNTTNTNSFTWNISASPVPEYYKLEVYDTSIPPTDPRYPLYSQVLNFDIHMPSAIDPGTKPTSVAAGTDTPPIQILGGDSDSYYDWTIIYPDASVYTDAGSIADPNKTFAFSAPDLPDCFAGTYSFNISDNFGVFSQSFNLKVPLRVEVDGGPRYIIYDIETLEFMVQGACSVNPTAHSLYEYDINGVRLYPFSLVENVGGPPPDEAFKFIPDNTLTQDVYTRISFTAAGADTVNYDFRVVPLLAVTGRVIDNVGNGIVGATITVSAPGLPPVADRPDVIKNQWTTITDGYFPDSPAVELPYTGETYSFLVSAPNKIDRMVYSTIFELGTIELATADELYYISGDIPTLTVPGESAIVELYYKNEGVFKFAGRTVATQQVNPDYRYNFEPTVVTALKNLLVDEIVIHVTKNQDNPDRDLFGLVTIPLNLMDWPITDPTYTTINLSETKVPGTDSIKAEEGGIFEYMDSSSISTVVVKIPPGAVPDKSITDIRMDVIEWPVINPPAYTVKKSGSKVYEIIAESGSGAPIISFNPKILITIPFDLNEYYTGAFKSTADDALIIRHSDNYFTIISGQDATAISRAEIQGVNPDDFWVDPIGNRTLGKVTFRTGSLSVFGVGTPAPPPADWPSNFSGGDDDSGGGCFIASAAYGSHPETTVRGGVVGLIGFVGFVGFIGFIGFIGFVGFVGFIGLYIRCKVKGKAKGSRLKA